MRTSGVKPCKGLRGCGAQPHRRILANILGAPTVSNSPNRVTRLAAEALVIVASILAAFGLEASWDQREERQEEDRVLEALHTEFLEAHLHGLAGHVLRQLLALALLRCCQQRL